MVRTLAHANDRYENREALSKLLGRRVRVTGRVVAINEYIGKKGYVGYKALIKGVKMNDTRIGDHIWINANNFSKHHIEVGHTISFEGKVYSYINGLNIHPKNSCSMKSMHIKYGLKDIGSLKIIK